MRIETPKPGKKGKGDEPTPDGERSAEKSDQNSASRQGPQGAKIRFALLFERRRHHNHEHRERQEQQAEEVHEDGPIDAVRDDSCEEEGGGDRTHREPARSPPVDQSLLVIGPGTADADGGQRYCARTDRLDPLEVEEQDEARNQDEATAGTDHRSVDADNAREDEQGGNGQRIHGPESGTRVRTQRSARSSEGVILAVMSAESPGVVRPAVSQLPAYRPGKGAAQAEAEHGITDAIKLASNENPYAPIPQVVDAIAAAAVEVNRYSDHRAGELRSAIADWHGVSDDNITVGCGSVGLIQQLFLTYVDPGDDVVTPWRSFEVYPIDTMLMGAQLVSVPLVDGAFDLDAVADAVTERTKLVLIATPNNPTGPAVSTDALRAMLEQIPRRVIVLVDEAYREFVDPSFGDPVHDLLPDFPNVVVSRSMSKAYGLAGLRVGYLVADPAVVTEVDKTLLPFAVNLVAQAGALAAVRHRAEYKPKIDAIISERERVVSELEAAGWQLFPTQANFVYLELGDRTDGIYVELERRGVVTRPFAGEGIRVTIGTPAENDRFLAALAEVIS